MILTTAADLFLRQYYYNKDGRQLIILYTSFDTWTSGLGDQATRDFMSF